MTRIPRSPATAPARRAPAGARTGPAGPTLAGKAHLASILTARDRWLLGMLYEHRVLTGPQISALAFTGPRRARTRLLELYRAAVIDRFAPYRTLGTAPSHWILTPAGAAILAGEHGLAVRELLWRHDRALAIAHSMHLQHDIGVNDWFTTLATSGGALSAWWSATRCARLWGDLARPDGYGRLDPPPNTPAGSGGVEFFLEYDCGTESLTQLCNKIPGYANLTAATGITTPILIWLPTSTREANACTALAKTVAALDNPDAVPIATAAADHTRSSGPAAPVWLPLHPTPNHVHPGPRRRLAQLPAAWPHLAAPTLAPAPTGDEADTVVDRRVVIPAPPPRPPREGGR
ncbi:hypothetical protein ABIA39_000272 [Nocardia sp. GAS34]|uniref:replication-relaxation family protein n=1 Tax=unclassified Nocardia TaxID=2637762 RepID=UPI003D1C0213